MSPFTLTRTCSMIVPGRDGPRWPAKNGTRVVVDQGHSCKSIFYPSPQQLFDRANMPPRRAGSRRAPGMLSLLKRRSPPRSRPRATAGFDERASGNEASATTVRSRATTSISYPGSRDLQSQGGVSAGLTSRSSLSDQAETGGPAGVNHFDRRTGFLAAADFNDDEAAFRSMVSIPSGREHANEAVSPGEHGVRQRAVAVLESESRRHSFRSGPRRPCGRPKPMVHFRV